MPGDKPVAVIIGVVLTTTPNQKLHVPVLTSVLKTQWNKKMSKPYGQRIRNYINVGKT